MGTTGSGKTTFGRALAARLRVPFVELDALFWEANWTPVADEVFGQRASRAAAGESWVIDGNYSRIARDPVWARADTVVWLDLPLPVTLWRIVLRTLRRIRSGEELWSGNRETFRKAFLSRDSLLLFALRTHRGRRERVARRLALPEHAHLRAHRFRSAAEAERWLAGVGV
jgi:adenylate kinase family enzyme